MNNITSVENKYVTKQYLQAYFTEKKFDANRASNLVSSLAAKGYTIEGYNDKPKPVEQSTLNKVATGVARSLEAGAKDIQTYGGAAAAYGIDNLVPKSLGGGQYGSYSDALNSVKQQEAAQQGPTSVTEALGGGRIKPSETVKEAAGRQMQLASWTPGAGALIKGAGAASMIGKAALEGGLATGLNSAGSSLEAGNDARTVIKDGLVGGATGAAMGGGLTTVGKGVGALATGVGKGVKAVKNIDKLDAVLPVTADDATKTVLNPFKEKTSKVSIPTEAGLVVKNSKELTPAEVAAYKDDIAAKYKAYLNQSKKFVQDRSVDGGGGLDLAAANAEKYVKQVDVKRKAIGTAMGEIEKANSNKYVDLSKGTSFSSFIENLQNSAGKANYAGKETITPETDLFLKDALKLQQRGTTAGEVLDFTRSWQNKLEDMKDKFGDFKDNKFSNSKIQNVINEMKDGVRNQLAEADPAYKELVKNYRLTSTFKSEANRLMGQNGLYNEPIKGTALMKRAVESNSDAGARQFLKTLRDITGYDGIADATVAIKAMKDAGDSQGLSLLGIMNDATKGGGIIGFAKGMYDGAANTLYNQEKRTQRLINKNYSPILNTVAKNPSTKTANTIPNTISKTNIPSSIDGVDKIVKPYINTPRAEVPSVIRKYLPKNWDTLTKVAKNQAISAISNEIIKENRKK